MKKLFFMITLLLIVFICTTGQASIHPIIKSCREAAKLNAQAQGLTEGQLKRSIIDNPDNPFLYYHLAVWYTQNETDYNKAYKLAGDDLGKHLVLLQEFHEYQLDLYPEYGYNSFIKSWIDKEQNKIYDLCLNTGATDIPVIPYAAMKMGFNALEVGAKERAIEDFTFTSQVNPNLIRPHMELFKLYLFKFNPQLTKEVSNIVSCILNDIQNQFFVIYNIYHLIISALFLTLMTYTFILFFKKFRHTFHRIVESFHKGMPNFLKKLLAVIFIIIPIVIFFRTDDLIMLATWFSLLGVAATWIYLERKEKRIVVFYLLFLLLTPVLMKVAAIFAVPWDYTSKLSVIIEAQKSTWNPPLAEKIDEYLKEDSNNEDLLFSRALITKRGGKFEEAKEFYQKLIKIDSDNPKYYNNLGNIYLAQKNFTKAKELYEKAIEINDNLPQPYYNLGTLFLEGGEFNIGQSTVQREKASDLDRKLISKFINKYSAHYNRQTIDFVLGNKYLWSLRSDNLMNANSHLISGFWTKSIRGNYSWQGTIIHLVLVSILFILVNRQKSLGMDNLECDICEKSICNKCKKILKDNIACPDCYQALSGVRRVKMQDHLKEKLKKQSNKKKKTRTILFSLIPGGGFIYRNFLVRGFFVIFIAFILFELWYTSGIFKHKIPHLQFVSTNDLYKNIFFGIVAILYWTLSMRGSLHAKKKEKAKITEEQAELPMEEMEEFSEEEY